MTAGLGRGGPVGGRLAGELARSGLVGGAFSGELAGSGLGGGEVAATWRARIGEIYGSGVLTRSCRRTLLTRGVLRAA